MTGKKKIPLRVKAGRITEDCLCLEIADEMVEIPWENIQLLTLGVIEQQVGLGELPRSIIRNIVRSLLFGEKVNEEVKTKEVRKIYLLDIFVEGQESAFRVDSSFINYRSFFPRVIHISIQNFKKLLNLFASRAKASRLALSLVAFICSRMDEVKKFNSVYDYEIELENIRKNPGLQVPQCEVDIESYLEEEDETTF